jgi:hypothetical protein
VQVRAALLFREEIFPAHFHDDLEILASGDCFNDAAVVCVTSTEGIVHGRAAQSLLLPRDPRIGAACLTGLFPNNLNSGHYATAR